MRTFSLLKGMPVYTRHGETIGHVTDICISDSGKVVGIIVHRKAFFKRAAYLSLGDVASFGSAGIVLSTDELPTKSPAGSHLFNTDALFGKMLLTDSGEELGLLHDVYFLEKMGTIVAYETTDGFFSEITEGKRVVESNRPPELGKDSIVISVDDQ
ncbi:PRC-barrel domain-containing protein [Bacillus sp. V59.32b]|uniref:PRC-barrel domain-containing protein n=1 Tax=Bacillus sp. V59.32b TaxID=1758642 RepID=UPI000E3D40F3|nr:PRC-barrel domain-containing protein [Bacillus sp. V59.32b]RFU61492.1 photosystem reaction center subunit H [Bacillus sp. V59.32b]